MVDGAVGQGPGGVVTVEALWGRDGWDGDGQDGDGRGGDGQDGDGRVEEEDNSHVAYVCC